MIDGQVGDRCDGIGVHAMAPRASLAGGLRSAAAPRSLSFAAVEKAAAEPRARGLRRSAPRAKSLRAAPAPPLAVKAVAC